MPHTESGYAATLLKAVAFAADKHRDHRDDLMGWLAYALAPEWSRNG